MVEDAKVTQCRTCEYGVETYDRRGYHVIRCEARKHGAVPWWYVEGQSAVEQTPTFPYLATPGCPAWMEKTHSRRL